ncbi:unnamed protein product [Didymodactylos carnosus]|uniref:RanBP2-type domain-containing protein n=1 Tax=Didymodactylos carnosus TaxID=1234261 RepID=A0A814ESW3_9BILA|nr:unnamed protein product [Didymodactylos carnosus]CAF3745159.1 unnamed protein product [Didymodactylos carnosus]
MPGSQPELTSDEETDKYEQRYGSKGSSTSAYSKTTPTTKSNKNGGPQAKERRSSSDRSKGHRPKQAQKQGQKHHSPKRQGYSSNEQKSRNRSYSRSPSATGSHRSASDKSDNDSYTSKSKDRHRYETRQQDRSSASSKPCPKDRSAHRDYSDDDSRDRRQSATPNKKEQHGSYSKKEQKDSSQERTSARSTYQLDKQDWTCSKCRSNNDSTDKDCYKCGEAKSIDDDRRNDRERESPRTRRHSREKKDHRRRSHSRSPSASDRSDNDSYTSKDRHRYETSQQGQSTASPRPYPTERSAHRDYSDDDSRDRRQTATPNKKEQHGSYSKKEKKDSSQERTSARSTYQLDKQDWTCSKCRSNNDSTDKDCYKCGEAKSIDDDRRNDRERESPRTRRHSREKKDHRRRSHSRSPSASDRSDNDSYTSKSKDRHRYETRQQDRSTASPRPHPTDRSAHRGDYDRSTQREKPPDQSDFNKNQSGKYYQMRTDFSSSIFSVSAESFEAYISKLPLENVNNEELENKIKYCLKERHREKIRDVKCNQELGVGIVSLRSKSQLDQFINILQSVTLDGKSRHEIQFAAKLQLTSYVVVNSKIPIDFTDALREGWKQGYKNIDIIKCEKHCVQFPNIFQIVSTVPKEMITTMLVRTFTINGGHTVTVYFGGECSFFEDLSHNTTKDSLEKVVIPLMPDGSVQNSSFYIEYNSEAASAVIVTCGRARKFVSIHSVDIDGEKVDQKAMLTCRLILEPWLENWHMSSIKNHTIFSGKVKQVTIGEGYAIVEISDESLFHQLSQVNTVEINGKQIEMKVFKPAQNPEHLEINALTWYETEMKEYENDIMSFVGNPQHRIFRYKWNPKPFLDQFQRYDDKNKNDNRSEIAPSECNKKRHLLRMTVMLNTIGIVNRDFYYVGDKKISIKTDELKTVVYNHQSKLKTGATKPFSEAIDTPYKETFVEVVNEDCLCCYQDLIKNSDEKKLSPVVLNMANADTPGGGYRRGDGAQEENLFRRSNYFRSLDVDLDPEKPTNRFCCNSDCKEESIGKKPKMYPMDEFGAIYTSGLTVFRNPEDQGYSFMSEPMYDVCAIPMAADPKVEIDKNGRLVPKDSIALRKKIENIFAIAYHQKHNCLVLSALGCGAFKNPPKHVALIFKSVIEQYAGFFKSIHFAIIDDHNAGRRHNREGNYDPFKEILHNMRVKSSTHKMNDMMIGPYRILKEIPGKELTLSDIRICYLQPCDHGGKCQNIRDDQHRRKYSHPPLCPLTEIDKCPVNDADHKYWFRHRSECKFRGECKLVNTDEIHARELEHPPFCRDREHCKNMNRDHLEDFRHLPLCEGGEQCRDYRIGTPNHCGKYRHCTPMCDGYYFCSLFHNENHMMERNHPFLLPCPFTPFHCQHYTLLSESHNIKSLPASVQNHCLQFSHVCRFGRRCHKPSDVHWRTTIHVAREVCEEGDRCSRKNKEDHLNSMTHPDMNDIRRLCKSRQRMSRST